MEILTLKLNEMESNELRIGNWVKQSNEIGGEETLVTSISPDKDGYSHYLDHCYPIQITEEWLIKFGFVKFNDKGIWDIPKTNYSFLLDRFTLWDYEGDEGYLIKANIKYVHELQNIFYALTGEELQYTQAGGV